MQIGHSKEFQSQQFEHYPFVRVNERANAWNVSFEINSLRWPIYVINPVDKTNLPSKGCILLYLKVVGSTFKYFSLPLSEYAHLLSSSTNLLIIIFIFIIIIVITNVIIIVIIIIIHIG